MRSNPVTYLKVYDDIRKLFSEQPYAKLNGYGHSTFSFNIDGGRCPVCQGEGMIKIEMQFMRAPLKSPRLYFAIPRKK